MKNNSKMAVIGVVIMTLAVMFILGCSETKETDPPIVNVDVDEVTIKEKVVAPPKSVLLSSFSATEYEVTVNVSEDAVLHRIFANKEDKNNFEVDYTSINYFGNQATYIINADNYKISGLLGLKDWPKIRFGACSVDKDGNTSVIVYSNTLTQ